MVKHQEETMQLVPKQDAIVFAVCLLIFKFLWPAYVHVQIRFSSPPKCEK